MRKAKKVRKIFAGIILAGLIIHTVLNIYAGKKIRGEIRKIKERGEPANFKDFAAVPLFDEQNAAVVYQKVFSLLDANKDELDKVERVESYSDVSKWTEEERKEIPAILAKHEEIFELLHEASLRPDCNFNLDYSKGPTIPLPHLSKLRACARLLYIKSTLEKEKGQMEKAVGRVFDGFAVARALRNDRTLVSSLVRIACDSIMLDNIQKLLTDREISWQSYRRLYDLLKEERETQVIDFCDERCFGISCWDLFKKGTKMYELFCPYGLSPYCIGFGEKAIYWYLGSHLHRPLLKLDYVFYLRIMADGVEATKKPYWEIKEQEVFSEGRIPRIAFFSRMLLPALSKALLNEVRLDAQLGIGELAVALRMYKSKNGNYPSSLKELATDIVKELPLDPFTGKDFVYRREGDGFIVYSLGENAKDDGGRWGEPNKWKGDFDIVWKFDE